MFERLIYTVLKEGIDRLATPDGLGHYPALERILGLPGREDAEIDKLIASFVGAERPKLAHSYARAGVETPLWSIVLDGDDTAEQYLGDAVIGKGAYEYVERIEREEGRTIQAAVERTSLSYHVFVWTENPDVTLAHYQIVSQILRSAKRRFMDEGMENISWAGRELAPDARYVPASLFVRQFSIKCFAHVLFAYDLDLGALATGRGTKVSRIHVDSQIQGNVNPGVTVKEE